MRQSDYDYIIVGAGSAGCVLARRLSDDASTRVLLIEAGGSDRDLRIQIPSAYAYPLASDRFAWRYATQPQAYLGGRRIAWPVGRVLGGSSSINGMVYVRGHARDFDAWDEAGATGWRYADVLPYFKRAETRVTGADLYRGGDGPLTVSGPTNHTPLFEAFIQSGEEAGYGRTADVNGFRQEGFGPYEMTVKDGVRHSAYAAYVRPIRHRANLTIRPSTLVTRVVFDGARAVGVESTVRGRAEIVRASRETVLCGGAIHSPRLLMLSGVGPADHLSGLGIPVRHDRPGVGQNLQDHLELYVQYTCREPVSLYPYLSLSGKARAAAHWLATRKGILATNHAEAGGFIRSEAGVSYPDIQFHFVPLAIDYHGNSPAGGHSFQVHVGPTRPTSRGAVTLVTADPTQGPHLDPNYGATDADRRAMRACIRLSREVIAQRGLASFAGNEVSPGAQARSDAELDAFISRSAESGYHYAGTCRMGLDADAVVDPQGRVHGIDGLRVADASVMPLLVNGNTNAASIMIGEKVSDHILGARLPALDAPVHAAENAETRQR